MYRVIQRYMYPILHMPSYNKLLNKEISNCILRVYVIHFRTSFNIIRGEKINQK